MQHLKRRHKKKHRESKTQEQKKPEGINEETLGKGCQPVSGGAPDSEQYLSGAHRTVRWDNRTVRAEGLKTGALGL